VFRAKEKPIFNAELQARDLAIEAMRNVPTEHFSSLQ